LFQSASRRDAGTIIAALLEIDRDEGVSIRVPA